MLPSQAGTTFRTAELERLATVLSLDAEMLPEGYSHPIANGLTLTIHKENGIVDHVGRQLFTDELRTKIHSPILDFLERYFLLLKYPPQTMTAGMMMRDDEFFFLTGSPATIDKLSTNDSFSFSNDQRHYEVAWRRNGSVLLKVYFPVEYELISGENKIEAENNLMDDVQRTSFLGLSDQGRVLESATYLVNSFSNRLYMEDGKPIINPRHPAESAANILLSIQAAGANDITITQVLYGFKKKIFTVPLQQWIAFCRHNACELYFGVKDISPQGDVDATVLAVNEQENYNHVLSVHIPAQIFSHQHGTIEARLYPYIPTHNVAGLLTIQQTNK